VKRQLVIKQGALGDMVLATGAFQAIRAHHADDHLVLLTTGAYAGFASASGYFDEIWIDSRPPPWRVWQWLALGRRLRRGGFERVYDLQHSTRTGLYFRLFGAPRPEWSGIATGCSHPHDNPLRDQMHTVEREAEQLAMAGIGETPPPDLSWLSSDISDLDLPAPYALLVPGGSAHRPEKRWPAAQFGRAAAALEALGLRPVLIGAAAERGAMAAIAAACPRAIDLCGQTDFGAIAACARGASLAIGNDTGPMHIIATAGCASLVLFSVASKPMLTAPRGPEVTVLQRDSLADLGVDEVMAALNLAKP
jgi:ADP-heptose:LPS heptosyltransferase